MIFDCRCGTFCFSNIIFSQLTSSSVFYNQEKPSLLTFGVHFESSLATNKPVVPNPFVSYRTCTAQDGIYNTSMMLSVLLELHSSYRKYAFIEWNRATLFETFPFVLHRRKSSNTGLDMRVSKL